MVVENNIGFDAKKITEIRNMIAAGGNQYLLIDEQDTGDEYAHFQFVGKYKGGDAVFDAVMYTLRLQHESELFDIAEHEAAKHFPQYKKITYEEDENGNLERLDDLEEEIGLYIAEVIMELEEDGEIKVKEHVDIDPNGEFGVSLDIGLHVEKVTPEVINQFISNFSKGTLKLDETLYSFQTQKEVGESVQSK